MSCLNSIKICLLVTTTLILSACAKPREASLPDSQVDLVFSVADFGSVMGLDSPYSIKTSSEKVLQTESDTVRAEFEVGKVAVRSAKVPQRLTYMFKDLYISGQTSKVYPVTFLVDRRNVTAFKVVKDTAELSTLEKQYARTYESVRYQEIALRAKDAKTKEQALKELRKLEQDRQSGKLAGSAILVPIFKYSVQSFGILERAKNMLKEKTSVLELKPADWEQSTHIMIANTKDSALPVSVSEFDKQDLDRTFLTDKLHQQVMTAADLEKNFQVKVDLSEKTEVYTLLDDRGLHIFEITSAEKLSSSEKRALNMGVPSKEIRACSADLKKKTNRESCVQIHRFIAPVQFVTLKSQQTSLFGEEVSQLHFEKTLFSKNEGLLLIPKFVEPIRIAKDFVLDSNTVLNISDLKSKEFFFRRTIQEAPTTSLIPAGLASSVIPVRFEFQDDRVVLKKTMATIAYQTGLTNQDLEEVMSLPATYFREELVDSKGNRLSVPQFEKTHFSKAQYVQVDWTRNTLASNNSPINYFSGYEGCISGLGNVVIENLDNRLDKGVLNFTQNYTLSMRPDSRCISVFRGLNDYSLNPYEYQMNMNVKERVSLMINDGSTDTKFGLNLPYDIQRQFHFGLFTNSRHLPDSKGITHREGTLDVSTVRHDFRNGKILKYHVVGLPTDNPSLRQVLTEVVEETIASWNLAYSIAFKGTDLERKGPYVQYEFAEADSAFPGDLDKHVIFLDQKVYSAGYLGITQVGYNPRSSVVVSDLLVLYVGNIVRYEAFDERNRKHIANIEQIKADIIKNAESKAAPRPQASGEVTSQLSIGSNPATSDLSRLNQTITAVKAYLPNQLNLSESFKGVENLKDKIQLVRSQGTRKFDINQFAQNDHYMMNVLRRIQDSPGIDQGELHSLVAQELLKNYSAKISPKSRIALEQFAMNQKAIHELTGKISSLGGCLSTDSGMTTLGNRKVSQRDMLKQSLAKTLSHEIGHSQGLTHNFIASFDKANYKREGETTNRNYSSLMDYMEPADQIYDGLGPYDIHALRASHTGLVELGSNSSKLAQSEFKDAIENNYLNLIKLDQRAKQNGGWSNATERALGVYTKKYLYCSDTHVWYEPTCQRHDVGSSASEVVENLIKKYQENYIVNYYRGDRLSYSFNNASSALGMSFHYLLSLRQFTDEFAYKIISTPMSEDVFSDYRNATIKVINFFNSIALAETKSISAGDLTRFRVLKTAAPTPVLDESGNITFDKNGNVQLDKNEKAVLIESKPLRPILSNESQIDSLGIMQDKLMALDLLTMQGFPHYKYRMANLMFSPIDVESSFLAADSASAKDLISIKTLAGIISGNAPAVTMINPMTIVPNETTLTEDLTLSIYTAMMSVFNLETPSIKADQNFANLFKVGSSLGRTQKDRVNFGRNDIANESSSKLFYWPLDNSTISQEMIEQHALKASFEDLTTSSKLGTEIRKLVQGLTDVFSASALKPLASAAKNEDEKVLLNQVVEKRNQLGQRNIQIAREALLKRILELMKEDTLLQRMGVTNPKAAQTLSEDLFSLVTTLVKSHMVTSVAGQLMPEPARQKQMIAAQNEYESVAQLSEELPYLDGLIKKVPSWIGLAAEQQKIELEEKNGKLSETEKHSSTISINLLMGASQIGAQRSKVLNSDREQAILLRKLDFLNRLSIETNPELNR